MTLYSGQLRLASYNCRGWNNGKSVVSDLLDSHDICVIQEHWLFADHLNELNFNPDFLSVGVSGMDSSVLLYGRPFGGCAIFFRKSLIGSVTTLALHFANKLKNLLSSDSASDRDSSHLDKIGNKLVSEDLSSVSISITCIRSAFSRLKPHKHDGTNLLSDHLIHALPAIDTFVAGLFSSIIRHGYMPSVLRNCILVPIPKGSKDVHPRIIIGLSHWRLLSVKL